MGGKLHANSCMALFILDFIVWISWQETCHGILFGQERAKTVQWCNWNFIQKQAGFCAPFGPSSFRGDWLKFTLFLSLMSYLSNKSSCRSFGVILVGQPEPNPKLRIFGLQISVSVRFCFAYGVRSRRGNDGEYPNQPILDQATALSHV